MQFYDDREFEKVTAAELPMGTFEACTFLQCNFKDGDLSGRTFVDCVFEECDFTNSKLVETSFQDTRLAGCKLMGLRFETCKSMMFSVHLWHCRAQYCTFTGMNLRNFKADDCELFDVDFTGADLSGASLEGSDLNRTVFERTNLSKTDFRNTRNTVFDPDQNTMTGARFSNDSLAGLLTKYKLKIEG